MTKPFGELSREEQLAMFEAWLDGETIEMRYPEGDDFESWLAIVNPFVPGDVCYRIAPRKPAINWDHVAKKYVAMITVIGGDTYLSSGIPTQTDNGWICTHQTRIVDVFASYKPGTCDWQDSLVIRPGYEEEEK